MEMPENVLTVIVPSYNVGKFLAQTLSALADDALMSTIEVLIINDGSRDNTADIASAYAEKYPRTFRLISKENGGYGSTFNVGIARATGKYLRIVDGDDWVNTPDLVKLVEKLKSCEADYVVTNFYEVDDATGERYPATFPMLAEKEVWRFEEVAPKTQLSIHELTIKTKILQENAIKVQEPYYYVDVELILFPVPFVETVAYFDLFVLMYRVGQPTQSVSLWGKQKHVRDHARVLLALMDFCETYRKSETANPVKIAYISRRIVEMLGATIAIYRSFPEDNPEMKREFMDFCRAVGGFGQKQISADAPGRHHLLPPERQSSH